eukprot:12426839-Karenia_brevis.AAC.1
MSKNKSADSAGIVVEMLQSAGDGFLLCVTELFNEILFSCMPPTAWKRSRISVIFKKGDPSLPSNYRPITLLPILYKLFSKLVWGRVRVMLDDAQSHDQAGFQSGFPCEDHLFTVVLLAGAFSEYRSPLWTCAIDFTK